MDKNGPPFSTDADPNVAEIGSGSSTPSSHSSLKDGPPFSTDADPNVANTMYTPIKGSAMKLLNIGSTPDGPPTKASSSSPIKPIGSGSSIPSSQSLLKDGFPFSTDADPNHAQTRFVLFGMIRAEWLEGSILHEVLHAVSFLNCDLIIY